MIPSCAYSGIARPTYCGKTGRAQKKTLVLLLLSVVMPSVLALLRMAVVLLLVMLVLHSAGHP
ncbi:MAG TPA: hypothetical protein VMH22_12445 [bacterium]|nr:hypothetical protein [bacterium]